MFQYNLIGAQTHQSRTTERKKNKYYFWIFSLCSKSKEQEVWMQPNITETRTGNKAERIYGMIAQNSRCRASIQSLEYYFLYWQYHPFNKKFEIKQTKKMSHFQAHHCHWHLLI